VLWNPVDLGYAATYVIRAVVDGKLKPGATSVEAGKLGKLNVVNGQRNSVGFAVHLHQGQHQGFRFLMRFVPASRAERPALRAEDCACNRTT